MTAVARSRHPRAGAAYALPMSSAQSEGFVDDLRRRVLAVGESDQAARRSALVGDGEPVPPAVAAMIARMRHASYRITDADVAELRAAVDRPTPDRRSDETAARSARR